MATVLSINISEKKGTPKTKITEGRLIEDFGFEGDAHAGKWHRQVSLLAKESIEKAKGMRTDGLCHGMFAENITTEGISQLRKQIDEIDNNIMDILAKRMRVCREIGHYKKEHNMTVLQASRYNEILSKRGVQGSLCGMGPDFVAKVFENIHEESVRQQIEIINK